MSTTDQTTSPSRDAEPESPLVSVVILSYNSAHLFPRAIQSVLDQTHARTEIIIVDNASTDGSVELLDIYADVSRILLLDENTGYARGMNHGYDLSRGEFLIPLNADAVLHPTFVAEALEIFRSRSEVGVVAAEVLKIDDIGEWRFWNEDQSKYASEGGVVALTREMRVRVVEENGQDFRTSFKANGACPVIRRRVLEDMEARFGFAPFDPVFDTYGEDVDFAFKAWSLRWHTLYARKVVAGHVRSYTSPLELEDKSGRLRINLIAERYVNALRHLPFSRLTRTLFINLINDSRLIAARLAERDLLIIEDVARALVRVLALSPSLLRFRRAHRTWRAINFAREVFCEED